MLRTWTPDLFSLDLLISVVELGSLGKAAEAHGISQPSASARLARLERQLGVTVLVRGSRGSVPTPAGEAVVAWASAVLSSARALTDGVQSLREKAGARLRVAASMTIAEYMVSPWLVGLRRANPDSEVVVTVANSRSVCEHLDRGDVDLGFIETAVIPEQFTSCRVGTDRLVLVSSPDCSESLSRDSISAQGLPELPLLLREPGSGTRDTFLRALQHLLGRQPELHHAVELGSTATILATARAGGGIGVVSERAARAGLLTGELCALEVPGLDTERPLTALWHGGQPTPLAADLTSAALRSES